MNEKIANEQIKELAADYLYNEFTPTGVRQEDWLKCFIAGAHSRDEEIEELNGQITLHKDRADYYHDLCIKLRNPN